VDAAFLPLWDDVTVSGGEPHGGARYKFAVFIHVQTQKNTIPSSAESSFQSNRSDWGKRCRRKYRVARRADQGCDFQICHHRNYDPHLQFSLLLVQIFSPRQDPVATSSLMNSLSSSIYCIKSCCWRMFPRKRVQLLLEKPFVNRAQLTLSCGV